MPEAKQNDSVHKFSDLAMKRIQEQRLLPTPDNYELWYVYFSEADMDVVHSVNNVLERNGGAISDAECYEIFYKHLSGNREEKTVQQAGNKIQQTIQDVNLAVSTARKRTEKYNQNLETTSKKLKVDTDPEKIKSILSDVLSETSAVIDENKHLEVMLDNSTRAMEDMRRDLEMARKEAMTDALTNLANRKAFDQEISRLISLSNEEEGYVFSMILLDIDHFKNFNDTFGHQVGDQVLQLVARTLKNGVKGRDLVSRYGGEEFAILLPETNIIGSTKVAEILRHDVEKKEVVNRVTGKQIAKITFSAGVSEYIPGLNKDEFIEAVDSALYKAKNAGRNRVCEAERKAS
ncbi:MAG: diguanylate cyclase [Alphaproteobacteria bacterium]|nr:diguanylate cyclase [Alphaproteobacteria bacterium]